MIRINLLAADRPTKGKKRAGTAAAPGAVQAYAIMGVLAGAALLGCLAAYLVLTSNIRDLDAKIRVAEEKQRQLAAIKLQVDALELKRSTFQQKVDLIEKLKAEQSGPVHMLDEISKALPDFVWLNGMDQAGTTVRFNGQSNGLTSVADFISGLERSGWFPNVDLASSTSDEKTQLVTYALSSTFKNPEVAKKEAEEAKRQPIPGSTAADAKQKGKQPAAKKR